MKQAILKRIRAESGNDLTVGIMTVDDRKWVSGELVWNDNIPFKSCIPADDYLCQWTFSEHLKKYTFQVMDVSGRTGIRIHSANFLDCVDVGAECQVDGCIVLGKSVGTLKNKMGNSQRAILESRLAVAEFNEYMGTEMFKLSIIEV